MTPRLTGWTLSLVMALAAAISASGGDSPERPSEGFDRAVALLKDGIVFEAVHELERFVAVSPDHEEARMLLANALYRVKREARAAEEASHVLRVNPGHAAARRLLTRIRNEIGRNLDRDHLDDVLQYARLCAVPGSYDRASEFYRLALSLDENVALHLEFARMLYWAGRYEASARHYERFLEFHPRHAQALSEVGRVYNASGSFPQAVAALEESLDVRPDDLDTRFEWIRALIWVGREGEAEVELSRLRQQRVGDDQPLVLLATIARIRNRPLDEYALLREARLVNPDHLSVSNRLEELEAGPMLDIARLTARLERDPDDAETRLRLVERLIDASRFGEAFRHLDHLSRQRPDDAGVAARLQWLRTEETRLVQERVEAFHRMRDTARNREMAMLRDWLERNAGDMKSRLKLAELALEAGAGPEAVTHLEWLVAANPDNVEMSQLLERARRKVREYEAGTATGP